MEAALLAAVSAVPWRYPGKETLYREVWGHHAVLNSRTLDATLHRTRAKIDPDKQILISKRGRGPSWQPRHGELKAQVCIGGAELPDVPLLTVTGPPGSGKTHVVAHGLSAHGTCWLTQDVEVESGWQRVVVDGVPDVAPWRSRVLQWLDQGLQVVWVNTERLNLPGEYIVRRRPLAAAESTELWHALGRKGQAARRWPLALVDIVNNEQRVNEGIETALGRSSEEHLGWLASMPDDAVDVPQLATHWDVELPVALERCRQLLDRSLLVAMSGRRFLPLRALRHV